MWDFLVTMEGLWRVREKVQRGCYCRPLPSLLRMLAEKEERPLFSSSCDCHSDCCWLEATRGPRLRWSRPPHFEFVVVDKISFWLIFSLWQVLFLKFSLIYCLMPLFSKFKKKISEENFLSGFRICLQLLFEIHHHNTCVQPA